MVGVAKTLHHFQNLTCLRHTKCRRRLIQHHDGTVDPNRAGDGNGLTLAAGQTADLGPHGLQGPDFQPVDGLPGHDLHFEIIKRAQQARQEAPSRFYRLGAKRQVGSDVEIFTKGQILIDDLDAERVGIIRRCHADRLTTKVKRPVIGGIGASKNLHQG